MTREAFSIPLLKDRHNHPLLYAALDDGLDLREEGADENEDSETIRNRVVRRICEHARHGSHGWLIASRWRSGRYSLFKKDFDDLPPVVVFNLSLHDLIVNDRGLEVLQQRDPELADNLGSKVWIERNLRRVLNVFADDGASVERLQQLFRRLLTEYGVYYAEELLLVNADEIRLFEAAGLIERTLFWAAPEQYEQFSDAIKQKIHGIKIFTDGALGAWTAALYHPYRGFREQGLPEDFDEFGMQMYERPGELEQLLRRCLDIRKPIALHAIGDRAIDQTVSAIETLGSSRPCPIRIEHAQLISESTANRAKKSGITLCMQPNFSEDSVDYEQRLPAGYPERNNPFRMLIDKVGYRPGVDLLFGSDGMPHGWQKGLQEALFPRGDYAGQKLSLEEFVAGYCWPDTKPGHIEGEIDWENRQVTGRVIIAPSE